MDSFRSELEDINNPVVAQEIIDLEKKIRLFREGKIDSDRFRSLRLARGIYGQRQQGVQMVRIKLPLGRISTQQLRTIADIAEEYGSGNLHATTRQDIQIHFVSLDRTPELWAKLEKDDITTREACGNTVRNITASDLAGIDPKEPFDVSPYAYEMFRYFLRNPVCQEMGRKVKIAFSSSDEDTAYTFIHDLGFIPKLSNEARGFRVLIAGGLGANPFLAQVAHEFLPEDQVIPFTEAVLRVFDRHGERNRRMKARLKFLVDELGLNSFLALVEQERTALKVQQFTIDRNAFPERSAQRRLPIHPISITDRQKYTSWLTTNVVRQKQPGLVGVYVKLPLGNMSAELARKFADVVELHGAVALCITINQGYLIRHLREEALPSLFSALNKLELAEPGFNSVADVTACPGTESCNLAISDSTRIALQLEEVIRIEYDDLIYNTDIKIKISGCPNSCGQHGLASIGLHGSTIKDKNGKVLPALVVLLGGGKLKNGHGIISDKIIKIPSKRGPAALRLLLNDYRQHGFEGEYYHDYFQRRGRNHFYALLKPLGDLTSLTPSDYCDWGDEKSFVLATATGECAGVVIDLVATLFCESEERMQWAAAAREKNQFADAIYHAYNTFINTAKAMLITKDIRPGTQMSVLNDFEREFAGSPIPWAEGFTRHVLEINKQEPSAAFADAYINQATEFLFACENFRLQEQQLHPTQA
jgi:sulfite reductase (ferredoxin)